MRTLVVNSHDKKLYSILTQTVLHIVQHKLANTQNLGSCYGTKSYFSRPT